MGSLNSVYDNILHECPYQGIIRVRNATLTGTTTNFDKVQPFPNGYYKVNARVWSDKDEKIALFTIFYEVFWRNSTLNFFESF